MAENHKADIDRKGLKEEKIPDNFSGDEHIVAFDIDGVPEKLFVGDTAKMVLFAACEKACDLTGDTVTVTTIDGSEVAQTKFDDQEGDLAFTEPIELTMPNEPGEYEYIIHYEPHEMPIPEDGGPAFPNPHEERDLLVVFTVLPHHVTVSTWDMTAPVWCGEPIEVCVGVNCSSGCSLKDQVVEIYNEDDEVVCSGKLHEPEAPRTTLWWDKLTATAPTESKLHRWEARFSPQGLEAPHDDAKHKFSFMARVRPERNFTITVIDDKAEKPQRSARVEIKPSDGSGKAQYATTNAEGKASIGADRGNYSLKITAPSRRTFNETIDLNDGDLEVEVHMQPTGTGASDPVPMKIITTETVEAPKAE